MNPAKAAAMLPIITAFAKGETVEINQNGRWVASTSLNFSFPTERYRIKPKSAELWAVYENDGTPIGHVKSRVDADRLVNGKFGRYTKKFVEQE